MVQTLVFIAHNINYVTIKKDTSKLRSKGRGVSGSTDLGLANTRSMTKTCTALQSIIPSFLHFVCYKTVEHYSA